MKGRTAKPAREPKKTISKSVLKAARVRLHGGHFGGDKPIRRPDKRARGGSTKWIQGAIKHPGAEQKAAARAGKSTHAFMEEHKHDSGKAGVRARLGLRLSAMSKKK